MKTMESSIGIFDSGMGGISVLGEALRQMPTESYIYYGDSLNAPYGVKSKEELQSLILNVCDYLVGRNVKAIVVACNTATSAAIGEMRRRYDIPVIGMEPALKPAVLENKNGNIAVLATDVTLKEEKFDKLMKLYINCSNIYKIPCPSLVTLVESGIIEGPEAEEAIRACFKEIDIAQLSAVVLGCTHFIFLKNTIQKVLGENVKLYDGNHGTIKNLASTLETKGLCNKHNENPVIEIINSRDCDMVDQSKTLLEYYRKV